MNSPSASRPTILVTHRLPAAVMDRLRSAGNVDLYTGRGGMPRDELLQRVRGKDALVCVLNDTIDRELLEHGDRLRVVSTVAVGYNNIDVAAARERGVIVTNTPDVLTNATADLTWALILGITRRIGEGERLIRSGRWHGWSLDFMLGTELRGKQLGIIGIGRIGRAVAERAAAFGMSVAWLQRPERAPRDLPADWRGLSFDELLRSSDVVSLHVPLTDETRHMIGAAELARMKRSAYLVNTARGPVVDEAALVWALRDGRLAGAALDVFEREPEVHAGLLELENVLLVPHLGSATIETRTAMADLAARNAIAVLAGEPPITPVP